MIYVRINTNRNNTITEISGQPIQDLLEGEVQGSTNYDFPTSQPPFFYTMDEFGNVEVNDEDVIRSFYEEEGGLTGLDLEPHIETVIGSDFIPLATKEVTITGVNFSPFSQVEISGEGNFINTMYFDSPKQIRVSITVGSTEGVFNLVVKNDQLHSQDSGYNTVVVKSKTVIDLRTTLIADMGLEMTSGINIEQDSEKGVYFTADYSSWNRGVKFGSYFWNRNDDITIEIIFIRESDVNFMIGIASADLDVSNISSAYYKQEIGMYHNNNKLSSMYGGGDVSNWSQGVGATITFDRNTYYKLKLENSGSKGKRCSIWEVNPDDWDDETEIHSWISSCPADDVILVPFILPQAANNGYFITGFRY